MYIEPPPYGIINAVKEIKPCWFYLMHLLNRCVASRLTACTYDIINT